MIIKLDNAKIGDNIIKNLKIKHSYQIITILYEFYLIRYLIFQRHLDQVSSLLEFLVLKVNQVWLTMISEK